MSTPRGKLFIIVGAIGLIALACVNWLILIGLLFLALIIWLASNDINKDSSRYTSSYSSSKVEYKEPKSPLEYSSSPHYIQQKAKHIAESIRTFVDDTISNRNGQIGSNELFSFWGVDISAYQTLYKRHLDNLIKGLNKLGYGLVPNYQQGHKRLDFNEPCVLYKSQKNIGRERNTELHRAELFIKLFAVSMNGNKPSHSDLEYINKCVEDLGIPAQYSDYLRAYAFWLLQKKQPYDKKTKDEIIALPGECKRIFVNLLTDAISLNGNIENNRIETLKRILPTLDQEPDSVHSLVHQSLTDDGFAIVETGSAVAEYTIRKPEQKKPSTLVLDEKKLGELKQQTEIAQDLLSDIFIADEEDKTTDTQTNDIVIATLQILLEKDVWQRSEVAGLLGPGVMLGNILEQINDYAYSVVEDIVVEEDGDTIYVTTEYKEQLI